MHLLAALAVSFAQRAAIPNRDVQYSTLGQWTVQDTPSTVPAHPSTTCHAVSLTQAWPMVVRGGRCIIQRRSIAQRPQSLCDRYHSRIEAAPLRSAEGSRGCTRELNLLIGSRHDTSPAITELCRVSLCTLCRSGGTGAVHHDHANLLAAPVPLKSARRCPGLPAWMGDQRATWVARLLSIPYHT